MQHTRKHFEWGQLVEVRLHDGTWVKALYNRQYEGRTFDHVVYRAMGVYDYLDRDIRHFIKER